jgi:hypothetical protein
MNNKDFWNEISSIIDEGFTDKGLTKLEHYAELFINQRLVYKRFSSFEQHGCTTGGGAHVIATLLAGANFAADSGISKPLTVKEERQRAKEQETVIENWAKKVSENLQQKWNLCNHGLNTQYIRLFPYPRQRRLCDFKQRRTAAYTR